MTTQFPKVLPELTEEQKRIRDDFMNYWHQVLPKRYGVIERFNHSYPLRTFSPQVKRTLDLGAGRGEHLHYENLVSQEYITLELRPDMAAAIQPIFPTARVLLGDCQQHIDLPDGYCDRVLAIHVLEHLPDLPRALDQIKRVLRPGGSFSVVIPCEGGLLYKLARNVSARRIFEQRYQQSYDWLIASEHINLPHEIMPELLSRFRLTHRSFFPFGIPLVQLNLCIGLTFLH